ncbi:hypothetical protein BJX63DRAFT_21376 [Aspergillus granulosus]|uniref:Galactose oxidase n=1 Tax=Aspergillus granulosus TaxID=176169 RepID=A0ABR4GZY4_9EURO
MDGRSSRRPRMYRVVGANWVSTLLWVVHFTTHAYAQIPYTPSSLLYSSQQNGSFAYLLRSTNADPPLTEFLSLDVSKKVDPADPLYTVLLDEVPFYDNHEISYIPTVDQEGIVKVFAGECWDSGNSPAVWTFKPDSGSSTGNGTWQKLSVREEDGQASAIHGPNYLSAGFAFSPSNTTESALFAFGGMCPYQPNTSTSWVTAANYSQSMTVLNLSKEDNAYQMSATGDRAPPIPEAGFTITPLQATYSYSDEERRQQQSFLLIGGHTQHAFINMSELAIFSAPQNSWSFVTVGSVTGTPRTDLAFRDVATIEPRSGHTSVLSADGSKVIVFGGWVGNTSVPALPQLAILEIGGGFAGDGEWAWKIPSTEKASIPAGIYGHGATMLPGGIMMIAGGYEISHLSKRSEAGTQLNSKIILYDVDSNTWPSSYENPEFALTNAGGGSTSADQSSSTARKAGLGIGIGLGILAVAGIAVVAFYFCRRRRVRRSRDSEIRQLALGAQRAHFWGGEDSELASSIRNPPSMRNSFSNSDYPWANNNPRSFGKTPGWKDHGDAAAERTGLLGDIHIPKKHTRPVLNSGVYRPPYHDYGRCHTPGNIHPIDEREEDEVERINTRDTAESAIEQAFAARDTQEDGAHFLGVSPEGVTGAGVGTTGYSSPDNDERTSSNLSDSSGSANSVKSAHPSRMITSNNASSLRTDEVNSVDTLAFVSGHKRDAVRSQDNSPAGASSFEKRYSSDSYSTAHSTLSQRQAEGEYLLRENPEPTHFQNLFNSKPTISTRPKASEWIGGIRRVLSVTRRRPTVHESATTVSHVSGIDRGNTVIGLPRTGAKLPRRSVSASAELFKRKQGAKDWGVGDARESGFQTARSTRDDFGLMDLESDEDWDVEGAAEGRRVQVTFTVPREKLRVVNATASDMDNLSVDSVSRSNSSS